MSLINQVLKDIDQRRTDAGGSPIDENVKPVGERSVRRTTRLPLWLGAIAVLAAMGFFGWRWFASADIEPAPIVAAAPVTPAAQATPEAPTPEPAATAPVESSANASAAALGALAAVAADWAKTQSGPEAVSPARSTANEPTADPMRENNRGSTSSSAVSKVVTQGQASDNLYRRAEAAFAAGRLTEGQRLLREALQRNASNHPARELLASVWIDVGRTSEAERLLAEGVSIAPNRRGYVFPLAVLKQQAGNETGALELLEASIGALDGDAEIHAFLAALLQRQGRHAEATNNYVIALRRFPANGPWLVGLGVSLQAQGLRQAAIEAYQSALSTGSLNPALESYASRQLAAAQRGE